MPATGQIYYVAGAGITGLTLALALAKFGATVVVLERQPHLSEFGAGLQISPNARKILDNLGLDEAISARSLEPAGIDIIPAGRDRPLVTLALGQAMRDRYGAPYAVMHRADLADALYKATRRFANIDVVFGVRGWDAVSHARGVTVSIDEAGGQTRTGRGRALIGADGVHSHARRHLLDGPDAQYNGRIAWRTLVPFVDIAGKIPLDRVSVFLAPGLHAVAYPLPHRGQVNLALFAPQPDAEAGQQDTPPLPASLAKWPLLSAILDKATNWTPWPLYAVSTSRWFDGNIGLAGDAAHAMVPFQAQGAAMGMEDAAALAPLLVGADSPADAFARYARLRQPRTARVARTSLKNGTIFHLPWPLSMARNLVIAAQGPLGHMRRLDWLYGHDALAILPVNDPR